MSSTCRLFSAERFSIGSVVFHLKIYLENKGTNRRKVRCSKILLLLALTVFVFVLISIYFVSLMKVFFLH